MSVFRTKLITPSVTAIACLIAIVWILATISEMQDTAKKISSKETAHALDLAHTFISMLPDEIPVYPGGVLSSDSPAAAFAEKLVDKGEVRRLTLLDRNERSILSAGRNEIGVYEPFPKEQLALKEALLLEDLRSVALSVPIKREGATLATVGILLPVSAQISNFYFFKNYYPHMLVTAVIILLVSSSTLLSVARNKPLTPLSALILSAQRKLSNLFRQHADTLETPVQLTINQLQFTQPSSNNQEDPKEETPERQQQDRAKTSRHQPPLMEEASTRELPVSYDSVSEVLPQLATIFDESFFELSSQRDVSDIACLSSCRENIPSIGIGVKDLKQVLLKMMQNACDMMPDGGKLVVRGKLELDDRTKSEQMIRIDVLDSGAGLSDDQQCSVFDPAFRTHSLPAEMVQRLLEINTKLRLAGGRLEVKSQPGKGSCFTIWLPL